MFDLITGKTKHMPGGGAGPVLVSTTLHITLLGTIIAVPLLFMTNTLPDVPTMMAFVAAAPSPPPPPPPPPPPARAEKASPKAVSTSGVAAVPIDAPSRIEPEAAVAANADEGGEIGGVEGGIPGGVAGGVVGGLPAEVPLPTPLPPAAPRGPVRIGGQIQPPTLIHRVEAGYPEIAVRAHVEGTVILEAVVNENGEVQSVKVLRSIPLLDNAAIAAVQQWRYSPVVLNGTRVPFILTVVMSFNIPENRQTGRY
jgi:protein TonB